MKMVNDNIIFDLMKIIIRKIGKGSLNEDTYLFKLNIEEYFFEDVKKALSQIEEITFNNGRKILAVIDVSYKDFEVIVDKEAYKLLNNIQFNLVKFIEEFAD